VSKPKSKSNISTEMIDHTPLGWSATVSRQVVRGRLVTLVVGLAILAIAMPTSQKLKFDRHIGAMFKPTDQTFLDYQELQRSFGGNSIVIVVYQDQALTTAAGMARNQAIAARVGKIEGVEGVLSSSRINHVVETIQPSSLLSSGPALFRPNDQVAEEFDELFAGYTHSADHSRAAIVAMLNPRHSPKTIEQLRAIAADLTAQFGLSSDGSPFIQNPAIVGEPVLIHDGFALIERDGARLATMTVALMSLVVVVSLADLRFVLLTATMIGWSVTVT
jgi:predicted RND superfamily exporter protein